MEAGVLVALIAVLLCVVFLQIVRPVPLFPMIWVALLIALFVGILLGPLAYWITHPIPALLVCAVLGLLIGWLLCFLLCGGRVNIWEGRQ
jgi:hypothetical protein